MKQARRSARKPDYSQQSLEADAPDIAVAVVPLVQALEVIDGLLMRSGKMGWNSLIAGEVQGRTVAAQFWLVVG